MSGGVEFVDQASPLTMAWSGWITLLVEDCAVVIVEEVHGMFFTSRGIFCGGAPSKECDDKGVGVLVELPGVVDDTGKFVLIMGLVVGDADTLGKKARVVGKVKCAG